MPKHFPEAFSNAKTLSNSGTRSTSTRPVVFVQDDEIPTCSRRLQSMHLSSNSLAPPKCTAIYVSNLHPSVAEHSLNYIFQKFGNIKSSCIARDKISRKSLGYGIVHFENPSSVGEAIEKCSGLIFKEQQIKVQEYQTPEEREKARPFTNLYVKNFLGAFFQDDELVDLFRPYGTITSSKLERDENGILKGFGFVCFQNPEDALDALTNLDGRPLSNGKRLYVAKHLTKEKRQGSSFSSPHAMHNGLIVPTYARTPRHSNLALGTTAPVTPVTIVSHNNNSKQNANTTVARRGVAMASSSSNFAPHARTMATTAATYQRAAASVSTSSRRWRNNIYVKNLRGFIDTDRELLHAFNRFGKILSCVVVKNEAGISKGFGFVCFENPLHAQTAIRVMHLSQLSNGKLLYCGEAQKKEERQVELRNKFRLDAVAACSNRIQQGAILRGGARLGNLRRDASDLCNICYMENNPSDCVMFDCCHVNCKSCLTDWFTVLINERQVNSILCLGENCDMEISPALIKTLVGPELYKSYDRILLENFLATQSDIVHCPTPGCDAFIELDFSEPTRGHCDLCDLTFCTNCNDPYHGNGPCDEFENETERQIILTQYAQGSSATKQKLEQRYGKQKLEKGLESNLTKTFLATNCKKCPNCKANIEKNGGCNHMECFKCKIHFCWKCLMVSTRDGVYAHFRNPLAAGTSTACTMMA